MKIETAVKRAKQKSKGDKELYKLKLINIGLKYYRAYCNSIYQKEWDEVCKNERSC